MVRRGELRIIEYNDEVEKKLRLVANKIVMTHEAEQATLHNEEVKADALRAFISGLKKFLKSIVFPAQPKTQPSALELAREAEAGIEGSMVSNTYVRAIAETEQAKEEYKT